MGFGFLFLGSFFRFDFPFHGLDIFPDAVGFALMLLGIFTLCDYEKKFVKAKYAGFAALMASLGELVTQLIAFLGEPTSDWLSLSVTLLVGITSALFDVFLLLAIASLAHEVGVEKIRRKAYRNLILVLLVFLPEFVFSLGIPALSSLAETLNRRVFFTNVLFCLDVFVRLLNLILILSCYMRICREGDEDMGMEKPSLSSVLPQKSEKAKKKKNKK